MKGKLGKMAILVFIIFSCTRGQDFEDDPCCLGFVFNCLASGVCSMIMLFSFLLLKVVWVLSSIVLPQVALLSDPLCLTCPDHQRRGGTARDPRS